MSATISERIRAQSAPTQPPRFTAYGLHEGECNAFDRDDDPSMCLFRAAHELDDGSVDVVIVERDKSLADLYRVTVTNNVISEEFLRTVKWCEACECPGHRVAECIDEEEAAE